jgi:hypothetical protein
VATRETIWLTILVELRNPLRVGLADLMRDETVCEEQRAQRDILCCHARNVVKKMVTGAYFNAWMDQRALAMTHFLPPGVLRRSDI